MNYLQIPSAMWPHLSRLSGLQLAIYCDAVTWESQGKNARRSNDTLAEMFAVTSRAISKSVARLVELGLVDLEVGANNIRVIKPRTTVHLNKCSPRTTVHPEQVFTPTLNECSGQHGTTVHGSPEQVFTLVNHIEEQRAEKRVNQRPAKKKKEPILMPFESERFAEVWATWKEYKRTEKRFSYKSHVSEQEALAKLQKLSNDNEQQSIEIIQQSIANGWSGFFPLRDGGSGRSTRTVDAASTLEWLKSPRRNYGYY